MNFSFSFAAKKNHVYLAKKKKKDELKSVGDISMKVIISQTFRDRYFQPLTFAPSPFFLLL